LAFVAEVVVGAAEVAAVEVGFAAAAVGAEVVDFDTAAVEVGAEVAEVDVLWEEQETKITENNTTKVIDNQNILLFMMASF